MPLFSRKPAATPPALWWALVLALASTACQTDTAGVSRHLDQDAVTPQYLMRALQERQARVKSLRSFIRTTVQRNPASGQSFRQILLVNPAGAVRLDTLSPFGQTLGVFIHADGHTLLYDPAENRTLHDAQAVDAMFRIIGAPFDLDEFAHLLYGNIPGLEHHVARTASLDPKKESYRLETESADGKERYYILLDARTLAPKRWMRRHSQGEPEYTARWLDYRPLGDVLFPFQVTLEHPRFQEKILVQYTDPEINPVLPADAFELALPKTKPGAPPS
jgi:outer membrane lipoprotein-sorting protein